MVSMRGLSTATYEGVYYDILVFSSFFSIETQKKRLFVGAAINIFQGVLKLLELTLKSNLK